MPALLALVLLSAAPIPLIEARATTIPGGSRALWRVDPVQAEFVAGRTPDTTSWQEVKAKADGNFEGPATSSGYLHFRIDLPADQTFVLNGQGSAMVYVNGEPRASDVYGFGYGNFPVRLKQGRNDLFFACGRGFFRGTLTPTEPKLEIAPEDATLPCQNWTPRERLAGVTLRNLTPEWQSGLTLRAKGETGGWTTPTPVSRMTPLSLRKASVQLPSQARKVTVALFRGTTKLAETAYELPKFDGFQKRTFRSGMDGSIQYYCVRPALRPDPKRPRRVALSLHGASVEATSQAAAYSSKADVDIVCATNRRPFGFNWEGIGRLDAIEVLDHFLGAPRPDDALLLTGHSMGGHGTWHVGAHLTDRLAALGPCAGWIAFHTYGGGPSIDPNHAAAEIFQRAYLPSDTLQFLPNLRLLPTQIVHGDADDVVRPDQARTMFAELQKAGGWVRLHEEKGGGHWYDGPEVPGAECMDFPGIFDLFARVQSAEDLSELEFVTASPGIASRLGWIEVLQQRKNFVLSRVKGTQYAASDRVRVSTENVRRFRLELGAQVRSVEIDGAVMNLQGPGWQEFAHRDVIGFEGGAMRKPLWVAVGSGPNGLPASEKSPARGGGFSEVYRHRVALVVGTGGSAEEKEWSWQTARYLAEWMAMIGNASPEILLDSELRPEAHRNYLILGPARINSGWQKLGVSPNDLLLLADQALVAIRPRKGSDRASVGVLAGSTMADLRVLTRLPLFSPGVPVPDWVSLKSEMPAMGMAGITGAGYYDPTWTRFEQK